MSEQQATYDPEGSPVAVSDDTAALIVVWRGWTDEERRKLREQVQHMDDRRRARQLFRQYYQQYERKYRAYEEAARETPFSTRTVRRIVEEARPEAEFCPESGQ